MEDEKVVDQYLAIEEYKNRFAKLFTVHENPVYFAFSKKAISKALYNKLTDEWLKMELSGEVTAIKLKYQD